jgi:hypothetical protein
VSEVVHFFGCVGEESKDGSVESSLSGCSWDDRSGGNEDGGSMV